MVIEVPDVEQAFQRATERRLPIQQRLKPSSHGAIAASVSASRTGSYSTCSVRRSLRPNNAVNPPHSTVTPRAYRATRRAVGRAG